MLLEIEWSTVEPLTLIAPVIKKKRKENKVLWKELGDIITKIALPISCLEWFTPSGLFAKGHFKYLRKIKQMKSVSSIGPKTGYINLSYVYVKNGVLGYTRVIVTGGV